MTRRDMLTAEGREGWLCEVMALLKEMMVRCLPGRPDGLPPDLFMRVSSLYLDASPNTVSDVMDLAAGVRGEEKGVEEKDHD